MGIHGLQAYLKHFSNTFGEHALLSHGEPGRILCVDGDSLYHYLYRNSQLDWLHGGQYAEFEGVVRAFVNLFVGRGIALHVFLDGHLEIRTTVEALHEIRSEHAHIAVEILREFDSSQINESSLRQIWGLDVLDTNTRSYDQILEVTLHANFTKTKRHNQMIFPPLLRPQFVETLLSISKTTPLLQVFQCYGSSRLEIAAYCTTHSCYGVLSDNTDFLVMWPPISAYIPLSLLQWERLENNTTATESTASTRDTLEAFVFRPQSLAKFWGLSSTELLPLLGCLLGNRYVDSATLGIIYRSIGMSQALEAASRGAPAIDTITDILRNCQQSNPHDALAELQRAHQRAKKTATSSKRKTSVLGNEALRDQKQHAMNAFSEALAMYHITATTAKATTSAPHEVFLRLFATKFMDPSLANIVVRKEWWGYAALGRVGNVTLTTNAELFRTLRRRIYQVLLFDVYRNPAEDAACSEIAMEDVSVSEYVQPGISVGGHEAVDIVVVPPLPPSTCTQAGISRLLEMFDAYIPAIEQLITTVPRCEVVVAVCALRWLVVALSTLSSESQATSTWKLASWEVDAVLVHTAVVTGQMSPLDSDIPCLLVSDVKRTDNSESWVVRALRVAASYQEALNIANCANQVLGLPLGRLAPAAMYNGKLWHRCYVYALAVQLGVAECVPWERNNTELVQLRQAVMAGLELSEVLTCEAPAPFVPRKIAVSGKPRKPAKLKEKEKRHKKQEIAGYGVLAVLEH